MYCIAGRAVWTTTVLLVCFHLVEKHTSNPVVHQFGMVQEISQPVNTDVVLHWIDLRGKVGVDWTQKHARHILDWGNRFERRCHAMLGDMPLHHKYFDWFRRVTRRFIDRRGAKMIMMVSSFISSCLIQSWNLFPQKPFAF